MQAVLIHLFNMLLRLVNVSVRTPELLTVLGTLSLCLLLNAFLFNADSNSFIDPINYRNRVLPMSTAEIAVGYTHEASYNMIPTGVVLAPANSSHHAALEASVNRIQSAFATHAPERFVQLGNKLTVRRLLCLAPSPPLVFSPRPPFFVEGAACKHCGTSNSPSSRPDRCLC